MSLYKIARNKAQLSEDKVLDKIYDEFNLMMKNGRNEWLEQEFVSLSHNVDKIDLEILVGIAVVSSSCRGRILSRENFMLKCWALYPEENLWKNL